MEPSERQTVIKPRLAPRPRDGGLSVPTALRRLPMPRKDLGQLLDAGRPLAGFAHGCPHPRRGLIPFAGAP